MADETGVTPDNGKHIEVTRMSIGSAEVKDMHVDLLEAVNSSIGAQTERIEQLSAAELKQVKDNAAGIEGAIDKLREINEELIAVMRSQAGGGEEGGSGGGGGGGIAAAELKTHQRSLGIINKAAEGQLKLSEAKEEFVELLEAEKRVMKASFIEGLIEGGRSLVSFRTAMDETRKRFQKTMEASRSGIADIPDMFLDDFQKVFMFGMGEASDSLVGTFELIQNSLQQNLASPMVLVGGNINEVAREMSSLRSHMEDAGLDLYRNLGSDAQSEVFVRLFDAQKRGDRMADIRDIGVRQQMKEQISALRLISENTGMSLDELVKANAGSLLTLAEIKASGMISSKQQANLTAVTMDMATNAPELESLLMNAVKAGGSRAAFESGDAGALAVGMRQIGVQNAFERMSAIADMDPIAGREAYLAIMQEASDKFLAFGERNKGMASKLLKEAFTPLNKIATGVNVMTKLDAERGKQSGVMRLYNKFDDFMKNKWPIAGLVSAISFQTVIALAHAKMLMGNTAALVSNTASRGFGGVGGGKGGKGNLSKIGSFAGKALKATGAIAGIGMVGKDLYDAAQGDTSNENTGALIGTAIGGLLGTLIPIPGVGTMMGMAVGNFAGEAIGGMIPSSPKAGAGAIPAMSSIAAPQLTQMASGTGSVSQTAVVSNMVTQTRILESIAGSMHTNNALQREIRDRIGFGSGAVGNGPRDSTKKANNIALIPGRLGS